MKKLNSLLLLIILISGCATANHNIVYPSVTSSVGSFKIEQYRKIAILPFWDAPNSTGTGRLMQGIATNVFLKAKFDVVERGRIDEVLKEQALSLSGVLSDENRMKIGKILNVNALVVGEVGQYESQQRKTDTVYAPFMGSFIPIRGEQWSENFVSVSLRIIDVENGKVVFAGSGQFERGLMNPPQQLAEALIDEILSEWFLSPGRIGIGWDDKFIIEKLFNGSPAFEEGLRVGDKLLKWNGIEIDEKFLADIEKIYHKFKTEQEPKPSEEDINILEKKRRIPYGYPGEAVEIEVLRKDKILKFTIRRVSKYLIK